MWVRRSRRDVPPHGRGARRVKDTTDRVGLSMTNHERWFEPTNGQNLHYFGNLPVEREARVLFLNALIPIYLIIV